MINLWSNPFDKELLKVLKKDMSIKNMNNYSIEIWVLIIMYDYYTDTDHDL